VVAVPISVDAVVVVAPLRRTAATLVVVFAVIVYNAHATGVDLVISVTQAHGAVGLVAPTLAPIIIPAVLHVVAFDVTGPFRKPITGLLGAEPAFSVFVHTIIVMVTLTFARRAFFRFAVVVGNAILPHLSTRFLVTLAWHGQPNLRGLATQRTATAGLVLPARFIQPQHRMALIGHWPFGGAIRVVGAVIIAVAAFAALTAAPPHLCLVGTRTVVPFFVWQRFKDTQIGFAVVIGKTINCAISAEIVVTASLGTTTTFPGATAMATDHAAFVEARAVGGVALALGC